MKRTADSLNFLPGAFLPPFEKYVSLTCDFLERLPTSMVIHRLSGDAPPDYLVAPTWCLDKPALLRAIAAELDHRGSWQGKHQRPKSSAGYAFG